jgi:hypothetical protein
MGNSDELTGVLPSQRTLESRYVVLDAIVETNDDLPGQPLVSKTTMKQLRKING